MTVTSIREPKPINDFAVFLNKISLKWIKEWKTKRVFEADPDYSKSKFFITAAFPYPNSPLHIGHGRTYTLTDIYVRFKRMQGYNVLFPMGFHYTGTPILAMAEAVAKGDKELIDLFINVYYIPQEDINELKTPLGMARYFHEDAKKAMIQSGLSIDWRREFTSITPQFSQFIKWQFEKLKEKGYVTQGTHPVGWCPIHQNPVGQHDTKGDVEPEIGEFTLILFEGSNGEKFPCATLRPETVFGVTNLWVNSNSTYVKAKVDNDVWVLSEKAAWKLTFQNRRVKILEKFKGEKLLGQRVKNPMTGRIIPILPGDFVDPNNASGVVMSVPAHAPYDYVALSEIRSNKELLNALNVDPKELEPISIIKVEGYTEYPARDIVDKMKITSQLDAKLEDATKELYSVEYHKGVMKENTGKYYGLLVKTAREKVKDELKIKNKMDSMYEVLNRPVYCRCGTEIVVKILENQWFIDYSKEEWKELARKALEQMKVYPKEVRKDFEYTIEWVKERACARQRGLGTELPWSSGWTIESLSDSTIYMAYYTISKHINEYNIKPEQLTYEVFDYVFYGKGSSHKISEKTGIPQEILEKMRKEFLYWYPLDSRHSAKDLIPNHLTFFIFNHVAIFPEKHWPRQIVVNGFVLYEGKKMSKSLRNIVPLRIANILYGPDTVRLSLAVSAEAPQDADFSTRLAVSILERLRRIYELTEKLVQTYDLTNINGKIDINILVHLEKWLLSVLQRRISNVTRSLEELRIRDAANIVLYLMEQDLKWYLENSETHTPAVLKYYLETWIKMLAPFAPFISEELWKLLGNKDFVSKAGWPKVKNELIDLTAEFKEKYYRRIILDIKEIMKVTKIKPKKIILYTAAGWKHDLAKLVFEKIDGYNSKLFNMIIKEAMKNAKIRKYGGQVPKVVRMLVDVARSLPKEFIKEALTNNEVLVLKEGQHYLSKMLGNIPVEVIVESEATYDPLGKARQSIPWKPAIFIESEKK